METALNKVYKVTPDLTTRKIKRFYKGVWGMSLPRHLFAVVDLITVAVVTFSTLMFELRCKTIRCMLSQFIQKTWLSCYHLQWRRRADWPLGAPQLWPISPRRWIESWPKYEPQWSGESSRLSQTTGLNSHSPPPLLSFHTSEDPSVGRAAAYSRFPTSESVGFMFFDNCLLCAKCILKAFFDWI